MTSKGSFIGPYFFVFDYYIMQRSNDSNDLLPEAISYFYPPDEQLKKEKIVDCGGIVGVIQYFQHDLFRSIARTLYFQKFHVAHQHYGRHSIFLCAPNDRYSSEEAYVYLKHIVNLFNILYGTWNHVQSIYEQTNTVNDFLNEALTPIVNYVLNQHRSISNLFSTIEYAPLKRGNQRVLLDCKHYLGYLQSKYGLRDGFLAYDNKILYSTCDSDTTFCLQVLCLTKNDISGSLVSIPWESEFRLKNGVSLYRIYIRQAEVPVPPERLPLITPTSIPTSNIPVLRITTDSANESDSSPTLPQVNPLRLSVPSPNTDFRRSGVIILPDHSGSSEETGFDTDTTDELSISSPRDLMIRSSLSLDDTSNELNTEDSDSSSPFDATDRSKTDDDKLQEKNSSRTSTECEKEESSFEKTIELDSKVPDPEEHVERIYLVHIDSLDTSDDEQTFQISNRPFSSLTRERSRTMTTDSDPELSRNEVQVTWTDIPDKNIEDKRDQLVLYVQRNSRTTFVGILEQSLLTDDYLNKLWNIMLTQMSNMDAEIQVIQTENESIRLTTDVQFEFNERTRFAEFKRVFDGFRYFRRIPSEESAYMAFFARTQLERRPERKVIGLSRGSHFVSIDRRLPDRIVYSCRRYQETI